ncbi:hypothetical protein LXL04_022622 [Taraxacum kok-saghyz]
MEDDAECTSLNAGATRYDKEFNIPSLINWSVTRSGLPTLNFENKAGHLLLLKLISTGCLNSAHEVFDGMLKRGNSPSRNSPSVSSELEQTIEIGKHVGFQLENGQDALADVLIGAGGQKSAPC